MKSRKNFFGVNHFIVKIRSNTSENALKLSAVYLTVSIHQAAKFLSLKFFKNRIIFFLIKPHVEKRRKIVSLNMAKRANNLFNVLFKENLHWNYLKMKNLNPSRNKIIRVAWKINFPSFFKKKKKFNGSFPRRASRYLRKFLFRVAKLWIYLIFFICSNFF